MLIFVQKVLDRSKCKRLKSIIRELVENKHLKTVSRRHKCLQKSKHIRTRTSHQQSKHTTKVIQEANMSLW